MDFALLLAATTDSKLLVDLVIILSTAGLVAVGATRLRLATVPAYLITGAIIGPQAIGLIDDSQEVGDIGSLAIVLLMFGIGLHFDLSVLRGAFTRMMGAAAGSIVITMLVLWPAAMLLGASAPSALVIAMATSLSSTAVVMSVFQQRRWMQRIAGRLALAILVVQDLAVILMLILLPGIARWAGVHSGPLGAEAAGRMGGFTEAVLGGAIALGGVAGLLLFGRYVLPWLLRQVARGPSSEVLMVLSVAFAIGAAALTTAVGLSAELGAFLGGFLLSSTPFRHHLSGQIGAVRDLFIAIFFTVLGMTLDFATVVENLPTILVATAGMMIVKAVVIGGACWSIGTTAGVATKVGLSLAQAGEFGLVILFVAMEMGDGALIDEVVGEEIVAVYVLSLILAPVLIDLGDRIHRSISLTRVAPWVRHEALVDADQRKLLETVVEEPRPHVIVAGFGVIGRAMCDRLSMTEATVTIVEMNVETVRRQRQLGRSIVFGDVSDPEVLENAGIREADALVLTIPDENAVLRACRVAKQIHPSVFIVARTNFLSRAMVAHNLGANETVVEEMATAEKMDAILVRVLEGLDEGKEGASGEE